MTRSSPPASRRSLLMSSPERRFLSSFLGEDRNTEGSHRDALEAAQAEHDRVREAAIRAFELHGLQLERQRIAEDELKEKKRLQAEAQIVAEELRLRELRAKSIPKPPPEPPAPKVEPPPRPEAAKPPSQTPSSAPTPPTPSTAQAAAPKPPGSTSVFPPAAAAKEGAAPANPFQNALSKPAQPNNNSSPQSQLVNGAVVPAKQPAPAAPRAAAPSTAQAANQGLIDRYTEIHQALKKLRRDIVAASKVPGSPMKGKLGTYRREIRVSIGQLTGTKGANAQPTNKIMTALRDALEGKVPSPLIDVSQYVAEPREPAEDAVHNGPEMPSLFIYLLNICTKSIISQFINEGGANPKSADPIGVFTAQLFSTKEFMWRGKSLIDMLMCKFRVVCPVVFGLRGNDKTERGRVALGWRRDGPSWITEQSHNDRMTGLGAGFAAVSLRDFSKSTRVNPYPPAHYWVALAAIVNSPAGQTSNTQYVVLRSMIEGYEQRILNFYGNAGLAALRLALVDFPKKAPENAAAAGSLKALADVLRGNGLVLA